MERLLKIRREVKRKKPKYLRQHYGYFSKLSKEKKWRKPRGIHSKILKRKKGHRRMPEVGYGSPKKVRGLNSEGLKEVLISNVEDLKNITDNKGSIVVIRKTVGKKKRIKILKECKAMKVKVSNYKELEQALKELELKEKIKNKAVVDEKSSNKNKEKKDNDINKDIKKKVKDKNIEVDEK